MAPSLRTEMSAQIEQRDGTFGGFVFTTNQFEVDSTNQIMLFYPWLALGRKTTSAKNIFKQEKNKANEGSEE